MTFNNTSKIDEYTVLAEKYLLLAIENAHIPSIAYLCIEYNKRLLHTKLTVEQSLATRKLANQYLAMTFEKCDNVDIIMVTNFYQQHNKFKDIVDQYEKSISAGNMRFLDRYISHSGLSIVKYLFLKNLNFTNNEIIKTIEKLTSHKAVRGYIKKIEYYTKISTCPVCCDEDTNCIPTECCHFLCYNCYAEIYPACPFCG